ncbi:CGNR zinc finger domain-containing protein [Rhodococcus pyridinivorans]|uniref:CGNR zinc finger domain-containing protein n=1 Tax=Rhodococcus pyridinivorans TaxID=103816 RepID=UPI0020785398|nr:ABATE domain-containing protein [Rhodococcus pyridinivorans]USI93087.1 CGNR zinc finger domain-containing protein [Rhodococcus pyridinivorans]
MTRDFPLVGEPLPLDLINTASSLGDLLQTPDDLRIWCAIQAHRLPELTGDISAADVLGVRKIRDHIAAAIDRARRGQCPRAADLHALEHSQRSAPAITHLTWNGTALIAARCREGSTGHRLVAELAEAAAQLLADPAVTKIRQCDADDCVLLFLPTNPRRRWCSATLCGNRVRVARHYQRHKAEK